MAGALDVSTVVVASGGGVDGCEVVLRRRRRRKTVLDRRERERMGVPYRWGRSTCRAMPFCERRPGICFRDGQRRQTMSDQS
jgi:hypothetical protein